MAKSSSLEKRFERLQNRLDALESAFPLASELADLGTRLNVPLNLYQAQLKQLVVLKGLGERIPCLEKDDISKAIIQALLEKEGINISQITSSVARLRGKASRRIIAERLARLEVLGIAVHWKGENNQKIYGLSSHKKN